jgi:putative transposase
MNLCTFVAAMMPLFSVALSCRLVGLPRASFYTWRAQHTGQAGLEPGQAGCRASSARARADDALTARIRAIHQESRGTYGSPRVHAELRGAGVRCGGKRVARLMRAAQLVGVQRRRWTPRTTIADPHASAAPDRLARDFTATAPNQRWASDITYVATGEGWLYLAVVLDLFSRKVVGWATANHLRTELALDALDLALRTRQAHRTAALVFHSDHGTQYTATAFRQRLEQVGFVASMGSVGDCFDNAVAESFFGTLKTELLHRQVWPSHAAAQTAIFRYIYAWYNPRRRHSTLGYASPDQFESHFHTMTAAA